MNTLTLEEALVLGVEPEKGAGMLPRPAAELLDKAVEDIPHVGRFCGYGYRHGNAGTIYCGRNNQICVRQVNERCPQWQWRGYGEAKA